MITAPPDYALGVTISAPAGVPFSCVIPFREGLLTALTALRYSTSGTAHALVALRVAGVRRAVMRGARAAGLDVLLAGEPDRAAPLGAGDWLVFGDGGGLVAGRVDRAEGAGPLVATLAAPLPLVVTLAAPLPRDLAAGSAWLMRDPVSLPRPGARGTFELRGADGPLASARRPGEPLLVVSDNGSSQGWLNHVEAVFLPLAAAV